MRINTVKFYLYDIIYQEKLIDSKNIKTVVFPRRDGAMYWPGNGTRKLSSGDSNILYLNRVWS